MHVENFDADHSLRPFRHRAGLDHDWVNPRMGHVVSLRNATVGDCSGTLVGPRFILTAAHCVVDAYVDGVTCAPQPIPAHPYTVIFDRQIVQDSDLPGTPPPVNRDSLGGSPAVVATSLVAVADGALDSVPNPTTMDFECRVVDVTRDMALLELAEPVDARGFARVRAGSIAENQLLPIIHHPGGDGPAVLAVGRVRDDGPAFADRIHVEEQALPLPAANDGVLAGGSSGSPIFDDEGYVVGVYSNASCGGVSACEEFSSVRIALPELGGFLNPAPHVARSGLGLFARLPGGGFTGFSLPRTDFGVRNEQPLAVAVLDDGTSVTAGFATSELGERIGALVAFDASGALMTGFQDNGRLADDIDLSSREEFVDIVIQAVGGEERILVLASVADPAEMMLVRYTSGGDRDTTFGVNGEIRISVPGVGADASTSAAALAVDPTDGSIVVAGHSSVRMLGRDYGTPVVARFTADGDPAPCGASGVFLWRPEVSIVPPPVVDNPFIEGAVQSFDMVVNDMTIVEDVGIVMVGYLHFWDFHARTPWVGRLTATCIPDQSFGDYGTGVKLIDTTAFTGSNDDNAWLSAVDVDGINVYAAGTTATFSPGRGLFGGRMFVIALEADGSLDASFGPPLGPTAGGVVVEPLGWSEVAHGLAVSPGPSGEIFVMGESLQDVGLWRRRVRAAVLAKSGPVTFVSWPSNDFGVLDAWATDVVLRADGQPSVSVALREDPSPFNPPPPGP